MFWTNEMSSSSNLTLNIPSKMFYVAYGIETLRTAGVTSTETNLK